MMEITVAAQCSLSTVETIGHVLVNSDGDYEAVAGRLGRLSHRN